MLSSARQAPSTASRARLTLRMTSAGEGLVDDESDGQGIGVAGEEGDALTDAIFIDAELARGEAGDGFAVLVEDRYRYDDVGDRNAQDVAVLSRVDRGRRGFLGLVVGRTLGLRCAGSVFGVVCCGRGCQPFPDRHLVRQLIEIVGLAGAAARRLRNSSICTDCSCCAVKLILKGGTAIKICPRRLASPDNPRAAFALFQSVERAAPLRFAQLRRILRLTDERLRLRVG